MASVKVKDGNIEKYIKIFNSVVFRQGILQEYRKRQEYEKPSKKRREKKKKAIFLNKIKKNY